MIHHAFTGPKFLWNSLAYKQIGKNFQMVWPQDICRNIVSRFIEYFSEFSYNLSYFCMQMSAYRKLKLTHAYRSEWPVDHRIKDLSLQALKKWRIGSFTGRVAIVFEIDLKIRANEIKFVSVCAEK